MSGKIVRDKPFLKAMWLAYKFFKDLIISDEYSTRCDERNYENDNKLKFFIERFFSQLSADKILYDMSHCGVTIWLPSAYVLVYRMSKYPINPIW